MLLLLYQTILRRGTIKRGEEEGRKKVSSGGALSPRLAGLIISR